jgi:hypothetical protein
MKKLTNLLAYGSAALLLCPGVPSAQAELEVSTSVQIHASADFYSPLASCGTWVEVGSYGRCWRPTGVIVGWQPYCNGYWVWTDCGWYWVSDEPWAWACYHYGYWVYDPVYGWIWAPGVEWAPAWVCWRYGGGYIGWAPIPPHRFFFTSHPADSAFVFVDNDHFGRRLTSASVIVNNPAIIHRTTFVSNAEHATRDFAGGGLRKVVINEGPGLATMEKNTGRKFTAVSVIDVDRRTPLPPGFQHSTAPTGINHEQNTVTPNHNPPTSNEKENGNVAPARKHGANHGRVPAKPSHSAQDPNQGRGQGQGDGHGHGHDQD